MTSRLARATGTALAGTALAAAAAAGPPAPHATRIDAARADRLLVGGSSARGAIGDWALGNGTICAVVLDPAHESSMSPYGGVLIDLGHCGRADDQWNGLHPMPNLRRGIGFPVDEIRTVRTESEASLVSRGEIGGVRVETSYTLDLETPTALRIRTVAMRIRPGERFSAWGEVTVHPNASLRAFTLDTRHPERSTGFVHPAAEGESIGVMVAAMRTADLQVLVADEPGQDIAYGLHQTAARLERADGRASDVAHLTLNGDQFTMRGILARPLWLGRSDEMGLLQLAQGQLMDLREGDRLVVERVLWVGARADVASVTDQVHAGEPRVSGRVDDPAARVHVDRADGAAATQVRPGPDGAFSFRLPPGDYTLRALAPGRPALEQPFSLGARGLALPALALAPPARLTLPRGDAMRLVFSGLDGTPDPRFGDDLLGLRFGEEESPSSLQSGDVSLAGAPGDPREVTLAPGRYRVVATRGLEHEVTETRVEVVAGETRALELAPPARALATPGWIAADMHVHSAGSSDSGLPLAERARGFAAQGGEVLVSTEHDNVVDFAPVIRSLGLEGSLASIAGSEVTSGSHTDAAPHSFGHANAFPMPLRPALPSAGALRSEGVRLRVAIAELRGMPGERVFQLNHPRREGGERQDGAFFSHLSVPGEPFEPTRPLHAEPNRALVEIDPFTGMRDVDFDAVELLNGETGPDLLYYRRVRADWLSLLLQGEVRTGTANSDSHRRGDLVALPVTYVRVPDDRPASFDEAAFVRSLRAGHAFGTTGPLLEVRLGDAGIGDRFDGTRGTLAITARAASWVPVSTLRVYVDAELVEERPIARGETARVPLVFAKDAFVTAEVQGEPSDLYAAIAPEFVPFAFTNPIFVDADADGHWTPPGLPAEAPPALRGP